MNNAQVISSCCHYECKKRLRQHQKVIIHIYHTWRPKQSHVTDKFTWLYNSVVLPFNSFLPLPTADIQVNSRRIILPHYTHSLILFYNLLSQFQTSSRRIWELFSHLPTPIPSPEMFLNGDHLPLGMQKFSFPAVKALYNNILVISTAAELMRLHRCLSEKPSATTQHAITSNCLSHLLPDHSQVLATSIHSPASELKISITGWVCTKSTALAQLCAWDTGTNISTANISTTHSNISTTEIATLGRRARQIARRNGILKFSG